MSVDFSQILDHPLKEEIISKIISGVSPRQINEWLKLKYPEKEQKHLIISMKLLHDFSMSEYRNYYNHLITSVDNIKSPEDIQKLPSSLIKNKTLQDRLINYVDDKIDINKEYMKLHVMIEARLEQIFDRIQQDPAAVDGRKEYVFVKYLEQAQNLIANYNKNVNQAPDQIIQHNYTVQYVDQQASIIQETVKEILEEVDPELGFKFLDRLQEKMGKLGAFEPKKSIIPSTFSQKENVLELKADFIEKFDELDGFDDE